MDDFRNYPWDTASAVVLSLHQMNKTTFALADALVRGATDAGELVTQMYRYSGGDDAAAKAQGERMTREMIAMRDELIEFNQRIKAAKDIAKRAVAFMDEAEARRKAARVKLGN